MAPSPRVQVRRLRERGDYDPATIRAILDEAFVCHLGFVDRGTPVVLPTGFARDGDVLYLHGAAANAGLRIAGSGAPVCVTVTLIDGVVLARAAFHHSINYRSVVIFGNAEEVTDPAEKSRALDTIVDHIVPGRGADARPPTDEELRSTRVLRLPIDEASAKIRTGGPKDDPEDLELAVWAGVVPMALTPGPPVADTGLPEGLSVPSYASGYRRPGRPRLDT